MFDDAEHHILLFWNSKGPLKVAHIYNKDDDKKQHINFQAFNIVTDGSGGFTATPTDFTVKFNEESNFPDRSATIDQTDGPQKVVQLGSFHFDCIKWLALADERLTDLSVVGGNTKHPGPK